MIRLLAQKVLGHHVNGHFLKQLFLFSYVASQIAYLSRPYCLQPVAHFGWPLQILSKRLHVPKQLRPQVSTVYRLINHVGCW